jgi:hypothetical protein
MSLIAINLRIQISDVRRNVFAFFPATALNSRACFGHPRVFVDSLLRLSRSLAWRRFERLPAFGQTILELPFQKSEVLDRKVIFDGR